MLPFPEARPTGPPANFRKDDSSEYDYDPFHGSHTPANQKDLPQIPGTNNTQTSSPLQNSMEEKKGFKWWWKTSSRKEKERRKSLGIGSSRTSYQVDHLSHGLGELRIESSSVPKSPSRFLSDDVKRQYNTNGYHGAHVHQTGRTMSLSEHPSTPPPVPPRPRTSTTIIPQRDSSYNPRYIQSSPGKIYRKYDPPPLQVPAGGSIASTAPSQTRPDSSAHFPAYHPQRSGYVLGVYDATNIQSLTHAPKLPHSATAPTLLNVRARADHIAPSHRSSMPIMTAPPILSPSHRTNISRSLYDQGALPHIENVSISMSLGPATPDAKSKGISGIRSPSSRLNSPALGAASGTSQQCAGYTKQGKRCKRMVKVAAPYAVMMNNEIRIVNGPEPHTRSPGSTRSQTGQAKGQEEMSGMEPRFCRDHAKSICEAPGFYWKGEQREKWINFSDWIPEELEEQTKVLLRLTMESALTNKESKGFIYAYELRDLQTSNVAYYKVGRTENVPRRLDEWKKRCSSHHPTLRDVFPLDDVDGPGQSMLPGAMQGGMHTDLAVRKASPAVKRLERLIHIELAAYTARASQHMAGRQRYACPDCQTFHQEIFGIEIIPFGGGGSGAGGSGWEYEKIVKTAILRWDAFVREIMRE